MKKNKAYDKLEFLEQKLLRLRTILIFGEINKNIAKTTTGSLITLSSKSTEPINLIISSQGGHVESGDTIHDMIKFINNKVNIIGTGWVASAGLLIYLAAKKENRYSLPNTRFLLHQPSGGISGTSSDVQIQAQEMIKMKNRLNKIFAEATGQELKKILNDAERDYWLSIEEAVEYGIVGKVIKSISKIKSLI